MDIIIKNDDAGSNQFDAQSEQIAGVLVLGVPVVKHAISKHPQVLRTSLQLLAERVPASAEALGLSVREYGQLCRRHLGIAWLLPETGAAKAAGLSRALGVDSDRVRKVLKANPTLLLRSSSAIEAHVVSGARTLGVSREAWQAALIRAPNLFNLRNETIRANLDCLAHGLAIDPERVVAAAMRTPPLLYQKPERVLERLVALASTLAVPLADITRAFCCSPSIATRQPAEMARRARLCLRLAASLGTPLTLADLFEADATALTFSAERLRRRYLLVRLGVWHGSWRSVLYWSEARLRASMARKLKCADPASRYGGRLTAVVACLDGTSD